MSAPLETRLTTVLEGVLAHVIAKGAGDVLGTEAVGMSLYLSYIVPRGALDKRNNHNRCPERYLLQGLFLLFRLRSINAPLRRRREIS